MNREEGLDVTLDRISKSISELACKPKGEKAACPKCNGTGWIESTVDGIRYAEECTCRKKKDPGGRPAWYIQGQQAGKW